MNRKVILLGIIIILAFILVFSLSKKGDFNEVVNRDNIYIGENQYWHGEYRVKNQRNQSNSDYKTETTFTLTYKGNIKDLYNQAIDIKYYPESSSSLKQTHTIIIEKGSKINTFNFHNSSKNPLLEDEDDIIEVIIKSENKKEKFQLNFKKTSLLHVLSEYIVG